MRFEQAGIFSAILMGLVGCGVPSSSSDAGAPPDAGVIADAGQLVDAGQSVDAGEVADAGQAEDAGQSVDAGQPEDAGQSVDAGQPEDAGQSADAGTHTVSGSFGGLSIQGASALAAYTPDGSEAGPSGMMLFVSGKQGLCEAFDNGTTGFLIDTTVLFFNICTTDATGSSMVAPIGPGTFEAYTGGDYQPNTNYASLAYGATDGTCSLNQPSQPVYPTSGSLTLTSLSTSPNSSGFIAAAGTINMTFAGGGTLSGAFSTEPCSPPMGTTCQ